MATLTRKALKLGVVAGTLPAAAIALGYRTRSLQATENKQDGARRYRASDLPIYNVSRKEVDDSLEKRPPLNFVQQQIKDTRIAVQEFIAQYKETYGEVQDKMNTGIEHTKSSLEYVQNNPGELPRVAFITVGSLGGFILGYRGGIIRKVMYGSVAGASCAALCYPQYTKSVYREVRQKIEEGQHSFSSDELKKGNWPFVSQVSQADPPSIDEQNRKKLGLPNRPRHFVKEVSNNLISSTSSPPVEMKGDVGQSNPDDKDMYSTRSS